MFNFNGTELLTYEMMVGSESLIELGVIGYPEIYNHSRKYGPAMDALSSYLERDGQDLKNFIFGRMPSC